MQRSLPSPLRSALSLGLALVALLLSLLEVRAAEPEPAKEAAKAPLEVSLIADVSAAAPGRKLRVGAHFKMAPHWHIYWREPGETGLPTKLELKPPPGFSVGPVRWPAPEFFATSDTISGFGYEDEVVIFAELTAPADLAPKPGGETITAITIEASTSWLVCEKKCIPGRKTLQLTLPIAAGPDAVTPSAEAPLFDRFAAQVPLRDVEGIAAESHLSVDGILPGTPFSAVISVADAAGAPLTELSVFPAPASGLFVERTTVETEGELVSPGGALVRIEGVASDDPTQSGDLVDVVLRFQRGGKPFAHQVPVSVPRLAAGSRPTPAESPYFQASPGAEPAPGEETAPAGASLLLMLLFAFVGGLILNVMPCVLPVLSIKVLSVIEQAGADRRTLWKHAIAYAAGIEVSFVAVAGIIIGLQASGRLVGWGFQFQEPGFVAALGVIFLVFALSLFGVFEVTGFGGRLLGGLASLLGADAYNMGRAGSGSGAAASFMSGVLAMVAATPCTAPFLAPALGFALSQPPALLTGMLLVVGLGLATPFLLLAALPAWSTRMPKPGPWMETFKQAMGFLLIGTTVWMIHTLSKQLTDDALTGYLVFLALVAHVCWVWGHWGSLVRSGRSRVLAALYAVAVLVAGGALTLGLEREKAGAEAGVAVDAPIVVGDEIAWRSFSGNDVEALSKAGHTVFIDFTAEWCANCKLFESTVIDTAAVKSLLTELSVLPVRADYTNEDDRITAWLKRFGRSGVPMYVILPAGRPGEPILLPDFLTAEALLDALRRAGPSRSATSTAALSGSAS